MRERNSHGYGWVIVAVSTLALVISNGLTIGGFPPFYKPIREEFVLLGAVDAARAETFIANGANIVFLMSGVFSLLGGWLLTRIRLKTLMLLGCVMLGSGLVLHSQATTTELVYLSRFLMGASLGFVGVTPNVVLVSNWFSVGRGTALGIVLTGTSLGGSVVSLLAGPLIANYGWRNAMFALSLLVWFVLLPTILLLVREKPEREWSAVAAPGAVEESESVTATDPDGMTFGQAVRTPIFWAFAACAALVFYPIFVTLQQFILYVQTPKIGIGAENGGVWPIGTICDQCRRQIAGRLSKRQVSCGARDGIFRVDNVSFLARPTRPNRAKRSALFTAVRTRLRRHVGHAPTSVGGFFWPPRDRQDPRRDNPDRGHRSRHRWPHHRIPRRSSRRRLHQRFLRRHDRRWIGVCVNPNNSRIGQTKKALSERKPLKFWWR